MRTITLFCSVVSLLALVGCTTTAENTYANDAPAKIKHDPEEVPAQVRAIETRIDQPSALLAEEIEIYVSKNYEWDVALSGNFVSEPRRHVDGGTFSVAEGQARATFRNLEVRAWKRIVFRRSDLNVVPFINITAKGRAAHATKVEGTEAPVVRRAPVIKIRNADIEFLNAPGRGPAATSTGGEVLPAGVVAPGADVMRQ